MRVESEKRTARFNGCSSKQNKRDAAYRVLVLRIEKICASSDSVACFRFRRCGDLPAFRRATEQRELVHTDRNVVEVQQSAPLAYRKMRSTALWNDPVITPAPRRVWFPYNPNTFDQLNTADALIRSSSSNNAFCSAMRLRIPYAQLIFLDLPPETWHSSFPKQRRASLRPASNRGFRVRQASKSHGPSKRRIVFTSGGDRG